MEHKRIDRRVYDRLHILIKARFFTEKRKEWEECTIFNISTRGIALRFHTDEEIKVGSTIYLEMSRAEQRKLINMKGRVRWIKHMESDFIGGIELSKTLNEDELRELT